MQAGKTDAFHFSHHSHASRPIFMRYMIGLNLTGEFMRKIYAASCDSFTLTAVADRVLCQLMKSSAVYEASLCTFVLRFETLI